MRHIYSHTRAITLLIALFTAMNAMSQQVSYEQALSTASDFFKSKGLDAPLGNLHRAKAKTAAESANSPYYIINNGDAFAIVAGDSRVSPILAYSLDGAFDEKDVPDGAAYLLQMYEDYITAVQAGREEPQSRSLPALTEGKLLTTATWKQSWEPWWDKCPTIVDANSTRHCYTGCAATAMGIIMRYHKWPETTGYGSKTYTTATHKFVCSADFSATNYRISTIPLSGNDVEASTPEQQDAIATLLYHAGVAASMDYDPSGSGSSDINALIGLCRYFGYNYGAKALRADYNSDDEFIQQIVDEINQNRPLLYSGLNASGGGHMFVCDGYDADYKLHFNFGWGGQRNGYYSIKETDMTYYKSQQAIFGLYPNRDAATTEHPSLYYADSGSKKKPVSVNSRSGRYLNMSVDGVYNITEGKIENMYLRLYICDAAGNRKADILDWQKYDENTGSVSGLSLNYNYFWTLSGYAYLPSDYTYVEGDCIKLFYSEDEKTTWHEVKKYGGKNYLDMSIFYDTKQADLKMYNDKGYCPGLHLASGNMINTTGTAFNVCPDNLWNYTYVDFDGDVAIFLCDSQDNPKKMISSATPVHLANNIYTQDVSISCTLTPEYGIKSGDRLVAFCKPTGSDFWSLITCQDPGPYCINIPEALIPTTQTVAFNGLFTTFCSANDLDFRGIDSFYAYTVTLQDSETLLLNRITNVPAGEGVLLMGANGDAEYTGTANILTSTPTAPADNLLVGVLEDTVVDNYDDTGVNFVFKTTPDIGFYRAEGETVAAGTAYMRINGSPYRTPIRFVFKKGDNQTGIFTVTADTTTDTTIYNLQGMKVTNPGPGIYIMGGKKVIIK